MSRSRHPSPDTIPPYPLYGPKFTLFRSSPFHNTTVPLFPSLPLHERRFRSSLLGDPLRRLQIASELAGSHVSAAAGAFQSSSWRLLGSEEAWARQHAEDDDDDDLGGGDAVEVRDAVGVLVRVVYEKATYEAVMLGRQPRAQAGFTTLPLIAVRMPPALRNTFINYLTTTFDARISPLRLGARVLTQGLETILQRELQGREEEDRAAFSKGLLMQLAFPSCAPDLKTLDLHISSADLRDLWTEGHELFKQYQRRMEISKDLPIGQPHITGPFTAALSEYLQKNLAFDFTHPAVVIARLSIGNVEMSADSRIRIVEESDLGRELWDLWLDESGVSRLAPKLEQDKRERLGRAESLIRGQSERLPTDPPPPYELVDPALGQ